MIVSADTLVYFGDLQRRGPAAANALRPDGRLIFTVERVDGTSRASTIVIEMHGRYFPLLRLHRAAARGCRAVAGDQAAPSCGWNRRCRSPGWWFERRTPARGPPEDTMPRVDGNRHAARIDGPAVPRHARARGAGPAERVPARLAQPQERHPVDDILGKNVTVKLALARRQHALLQRLRDALFGGRDATAATTATSPSVRPGSGS